MYESWFGLQRRPFRMAPDASRFFESSDIKTAFDLITSSIQSGAGPALIVGPMGVGKTTLSLRIKEHFSGQTTVAMISGSTCYSRRSLLQNTLAQVGLPFTDPDDNQLRLSLQEFFNSRTNGSVLVVDEAGMLKPEALEEIRTLSALTHEGRWSVNVVLLGTMRLEETMALPPIESLNQRIAVRCYLGPWTRDETQCYIMNELAVAGYTGPHIFDMNAVAKIQSISGGVPRIVNQLGDRCLALAFKDSSKTIGEEQVEIAWADIQQLPGPESREHRRDGDVLTDSIVEFGNLDEVASGDSDSVDEDHTILENASTLPLGEEGSSATSHPATNPEPDHSVKTYDEESELMPALDLVDDLVSTAAMAESAANIGTEVPTAAAESCGDETDAVDELAESYPDEDTVADEDWLETAPLDEAIQMDDSSASLKILAGGATTTPIAASLVEQQLGRSPHPVATAGAASDPELVAENRAAAHAPFVEFSEHSSAAGSVVTSVPTNTGSEFDEIEQAVSEISEEARVFASPDAPQAEEAGENPFFEMFDEEEVVFGRPEGLQQNHQILTSDVSTECGQQLIDDLEDSPESVAEASTDDSSTAVDSTAEFPVSGIVDTPIDVEGQAHPEAVDELAPVDDSESVDDVELIVESKDSPAEPISAPPHEPIVVGSYEVDGDQDGDVDEDGDVDPLAGPASDCNQPVVQEIVDERSDRELQVAVEAFLHSQSEVPSVDEPSTPTRDACDPLVEEPTLSEAPHHDAVAVDHQAIISPVVDSGIVTPSSELPPFESEGPQGELALAVSQSPVVQAENVDATYSVQDNDYASSAAPEKTRSDRRFSRLFTGLRKKN